MTDELQVNDLVEWQTYRGVRRGRVVAVHPTTGNVTVEYVADPHAAEVEVVRYTMTQGGARRHLTIYERGVPRARKG